MFFINLVFVDRKIIWKLNKKYRKVDKPTTVLSFYYGKGQANFPAGEVFICPQEAKRQKIKLEELIFHGVNNILSEIPAAETRRIGFG
jgi:rRNA maturation RNase YbeY